MVDVVYVAASSQDARFTRTCIASIRYFYPEVPIRLLAGGRLVPGLLAELERHWDVEGADIPTIEYGWGFVKLEPLFGSPAERFLVLDSDTALIGPILDLAAANDADFIIDAEDQTPERASEIYYDVGRGNAEGLPIAAPEFLFNTGQWFGRSGVLTRDDFAPFIQWGSPRRVTKPAVFKNGEQGVLNFVVNEKWRQGKLRVARAPLMLWPGHGMGDVNASGIQRRTAAPRIVHWAGMKARTYRHMVGGDVLRYFENEYYRRMPAPRARRALAHGAYLWSRLNRRIRLRTQ